MKSFSSMTQLVRAQFEPYQRATWFLVECMEREHVMTLRAMAPMWMRSPAALNMRSTQAAPPRHGCTLRTAGADRAHLQNAVRGTASITVDSNEVAAPPDMCVAKV